MYIRENDQQNPFNTILFKKFRPFIYFNNVIMIDRKIKKFTYKDKSLENLRILLPFFVVSLMLFMLI